MRRHNTHTPRSHARSGFTLIELIVVILVIAIIISIIAPMLGRARAVARSAMTNAMQADLVKASQQFRTDENRWPGYFTAREMGAQENRIGGGSNRGFSAMQNVLLDLAGGVRDGSIIVGTPVVLNSVGPIARETVQVEVGAIGVLGMFGNKNYYNPDAKFFEPQDSVTGGASATGTLIEHTQLPSLIDAFGNPMLAWAEDESAPRQIEGTQLVNNFVKLDTGSNDDEPARFYWGSNSVFTMSTQLGRTLRDQVGSPSTRQYSLFAVGNPGVDPLISLMGFLGSPSSPVDMAATDILPSEARGGMVFHSAGADGFYFNGRVRKVGNPAAALDYTRSFYADAPSTSTRQLDDSGSPTTVDVIDDFDDLVISSGG